MAVVTAVASASASSRVGFHSMKQQLTPAAICQKQRAFVSQRSSLLRSPSFFESPCRIGSSSADAVNGAGAGASDCLSGARAEVAKEDAEERLRENGGSDGGRAQECLEKKSLRHSEIWQRKQTRARALDLPTFAKPTDGRVRNLVGSGESESSKIRSFGAKPRWFPHLDAYHEVEGTSVSSATVVELLEPFISPERKQRIENVINNRTHSVSVVVEGLVDVGNVSAICRTADAMGFQSVHVISNKKSQRFRENHRTSAGAEKWLDMETHSDTTSCINILKTRGYRIAVTHVADDTVSIHDMDWTIPTAFLLGNEHKGISEEALALSDVRCSIPMAGMVESFNVSVAAAIVMHQAVTDRISRMGAHGDLSEDEKNALRAAFYMRHRDDTKKILEGLVKRKLVEARLHEEGSQGSTIVHGDNFSIKSNLVEGF